MKPLVLFAAAAVGLGMAVACGAEPPKVDPRPAPTPTLERASIAAGRQVTDMAGRSVAIPEVVQHVVALSPSAADFLAALGMEPVGRPSDATGAALANVPAIGSTLSPDFKAIAGLNPDLVIADAAYHGARLRDFGQFPYPVYIIKAGDYDGVLATLTALGQVTGRTSEAASARAAIEERVAALLARVAGAPPPSVLIVTGSGREVYAGSEATYAGGLVKKLGATNVMAEVPQGAPLAGFGLVELGQVAARNPGVVLAIPSGAGGLAAQIRSSPAWATATAVVSGRVFELDAGLYLRRPGPLVADALEELARLLYPGR